MVFLYKKEKYKTAFKIVYNRAVEVRWMILKIEDYILSGFEI